MLLIVDEAQNLDALMLEELRVLSNVNADRIWSCRRCWSASRSCATLCGAPELRQLAQRIGTDYHLPTLTLQDTRAYVRHRLERRGRRSPELFRRATRSISSGRAAAACRG